MARPMASAIGIGTALSPEQWSAAHASALEASRARRAAREREQQWRQALPPLDELEAARQRQSAPSAQPAPQAAPARPGSRLPVLVCRDFRVTPPEAEDRDPVLLATLNFNEGLVVTHVTLSGKAYARAEQYRDVRMWSETTDDVHWSGVWNRDPNRKMVGEARYDGTRGSYVEKIYDRGRLENTITSTCKRADDTGTPTGADTRGDDAGSQWPKWLLLDSPIRERR